MTLRHTSIIDHSRLTVTSRTDVDGRVLGLDLVVHVGYGERVGRRAADAVEALRHDEVPVVRRSRVFARDYRLVHCNRTQLLRTCEYVQCISYLLSQLLHCYRHANYSMVDSLTTKTIRT